MKTSRPAPRLHCHGYYKDPDASQASAITRHYVNYIVPGQYIVASHEWKRSLHWWNFNKRISFFCCMCLCFPPTYYWPLPPKPLFWLPIFGFPPKPSFWLPIFGLPPKPLFWLPILVCRQNLCFGYLFLVCRQNLCFHQPILGLQSILQTKNRLDDLRPAVRSRFNRSLGDT